MSAPTPTTLVKPRISNRYELLSPLGAGGMGAVWRAMDRLTQEEVALKRLHSSTWQPASDDLRLSLAHEFQALAALRHPGVITVRDYGFDQEQLPYFTMEILPQARPITVIGEQLSENGRIQLLLQLFTTLIYVHRCGIIHRDLKPGNVLVDSQGNVKVLDFGLALTPGVASLPSGTLAYMAPELLRGGTATVASDLYAVGLMAYELWAGWHPFHHETNLPLAILQQAPDFSLLGLSPAVQAVVQRLLAKEPTARYDSAAEALAALCTAVHLPLPPESMAARESFLQAAPFIGRTAELACLEAARQQAVQGHGSGWLVVGESGMGKSRLLQELRIVALVNGAQVLRGQAQANGGAYHLWAELLRPLLLQTAPTDLETAVLHAIMPDIAGLVGRPVRPAPPLAAAAAQARLHLTVVDLLARAAAEQPLLLVLEDVHWADENSLLLLEQFVTRCQQMALCLVASCRLYERRELLARLADLSRLDLRPLAAEAVAELSAAMLGENGRLPSLLHFLQRETEGNTFFIVEVVRALAEEAGRLDQIGALALPATVFPQGIQQVAQRRLGRVPPPYLRLLKKAALAGRQLDFALLAYLAPRSRLESWLTACAQAGVLERETGADRWHFSHDKLREAVLHKIGPSWRRRWHQQIAHGLETVYAADLAPHAANLAHHFAAAGLPDAQRRYLWLAGQHAEKGYANEAAISLYEQLLALLPDDAAQKGSTLLVLGNLYKVNGQVDEALVALTAVLTLPAISPHQQGQARQMLGNLERNRGQYQAALNWLTPAQADFAAVQDMAGLCQVRLEIANILYQQGQYQTALAELGTALKLAPDDASRARVQHNLGSVAYSQGAYETAVAHFQVALALRQAAEDWAELADSYNNLGLIAYRHGEWAAAQDNFAASLELRRKVGDRWGIPAALANLGMIPYQQRDYEAASRYWQEALLLRRQLGDVRHVASMLDNLALVAIAQQDYATAQKLFEEAILLRQQQHDQQGLAITYTNRGRLAFLQQIHPAAVTDYRAGLALSLAIGDQIGVVFALTGVAAVWAATERFEPAARLLAAAAKHLEQIGGAWESDEKGMFEAALAQVEDSLSADVLAAAWLAGERLVLATAVQFVDEVLDDRLTV